MKLAIMQPYVYPYIGYFHLIDSCNTFVFYDDVNFIKRGWINRNKILQNGEELLFTIPLRKASQNKMINEIELSIDDKWKKNFYRQIDFSYKKAPFFNEVLDLIQSLFEKDFLLISDLSIQSVVQVMEFLGLDFNYKISSEISPESQGMDKADRLIHIAHQLNCKTYINASGGKEIYTKDYFNKKDVDLFFIESQLRSYPQIKRETFMPHLSIIDILMNTPKDEVKKMFEEYKLI